MSTTRCIATATGFYRGARIRPGQAFDFVGEKLPKWARSADDKPPAPKPALDADLKPKAAQAAAKRKMAGATPDESAPSTDLA